MKYSNRGFLQRLCKRVTLGKVRKKLSLFVLKNEGYASLGKPVFVLSTGRCRTHWLSSVISEQKMVYVEHNPEIIFLQEGRLIYENSDNFGDMEYLFLQLLFTARDHIWLDCAKRNLRYIETNNRITFAVPFLKKELKSSKFLHLTRHPIDFIRSGRNRKWYEGDSHDLGRITLKDKAIWKSLNLNQKIGWLWYETNLYILKHTKDLPESRYLQMASEELNQDGIRKVIEFMELNTSLISGGCFRKATNTQEKKIKLTKSRILSDLMRSPFSNEIHLMAETLGYKL